MELVVKGNRDIPEVWYEPAKEVAERKEGLEFCLTG